MAHYLVRAEPKESKLPELAERLAEQAFIEMRPFGQALTKGLADARLLEDGRAIWEEEDYCSPPLAMEREAVLDRYFRGIEVQKVHEGEGWEQIRDLPSLFNAVNSTSSNRTVNGSINGTRNSTVRGA